MFDVLGKITSLREERGWTTYRLSKLSGIPQSTISTWYRKNLMPPIDKLEIICQTFGITLAEFFNDTDVLVSMTEEEKNMLSLKCIFNFQLARVNSSLIEITSAHIYCH